MKTYFIFAPLFSLTIFLTGCTSLPFSTPFKVVEKTKNDLIGSSQQDLWVVLTYTEIDKTGSNNSEFKNHVMKIYDNLEDTPGLYGYSIRKEFFGNKAWTMTVWKDLSFVEQFKISEHHLPAMADAGKLLNNASFARFKIKLSELPLSWSDVLPRLDENARSYNF